MPVLTGPLERGGPLIDIKVMASRQRVEALKKAGKPWSPPRVVRGLLDTGASSSVIDFRLAHSLGLERRGVARIHTPSSGSVGILRNQYDACFTIGDIDEGEPRVVHATLPVIESDFEGQGFSVLVGCDVLNLCAFSHMMDRKSVFGDNF